MSQLTPTLPNSVSVGSPDFSRPTSATPAISTPPAPPQIAIAVSMGSGFAPFEWVKKYLTNKPLRIRIADDPDMNEVVNQLAKQWKDQRPRGTEIHEMVEAPAYQAIISLGYRAVRPLLLMLHQNQDHWYYALHEITGENPVPPESEGRLTEMAEAWIKWGKEHGYLGSMD